MAVVEHLVEQFIDEDEVLSDRFLRQETAIVLHVDGEKRRRRGGIRVGHATMRRVRRKGSHDQLERSLDKTCTGESLLEKTMEKMTVRIYVRCVDRTGWKSDFLNRLGTLAACAAIRVRVR